MLSEWQVTPCTSRLAAGDYETARADAIALLSKSPDFVSLVEYGSVSVPGLSDLDFIVGLKDNPSADASASISKANLPHSVMRVMDYATLMVMPHSTLAKVKMWDDIDAKVIAGPSVDFKSYDDIETQVARIIDWLPERICRISELLNSKIINERRAIGLLKSTLYSIRAVDQIVGPSLWAEKLASEIEATRRDWFSLPEPRWLLLADLLTQTLIASETSWRVFVDWLEDQNIYGPVDTSGELRFTNRTVFRFDLGPESRNEVCVVRNGVTNFRLPRELQRHFTTYASGSGVVSHNLRAAMTGADIFPISAAMAQCLNARIKICNEWGGFLKRNNFKSGMFKFGWFFN